MTRTDNDSWDLASSVGATATLVAAARAAATRLPDPVIDDPYAEPARPCRRRGLLHPDGGGRHRYRPGGHGRRPDDRQHGRPNALLRRVLRRSRWAATSTGAAGPTTSNVRAADAGIRQAVILAAGLDSRAFRLAWPPDMVVYEIDQPEVVTFRSDTMTELGVTATCVRRTVAMDLRNDWATALRGAAFDPNKPTAWSAEGLLGYLPPDAQDRLLDTITGLSAPAAGSPSTVPPPSDPARSSGRANACGRSPTTGASRLPSGLQRVGLHRRTQRGQRLPDRSWLAGGRHRSQRPVGRARPGAVRRRRTDVEAPLPRGDPGGPTVKHRRRQLGPGLQRRGHRDDGGRCPRRGQPEENRSSTIRSRRRWCGRSGSSTSPISSTVTSIPPPSTTAVAPGC